MAHDLILGRTNRDWSCGRDSFGDETITSDVHELAKLTTDEISRNANSVIQLSKNKRLPEAEKESFKSFHRKWLAFNDRRQRRFVNADRAELQSFLLANRRFTPRLAVLTQLAATPLKPQAQFAPPGSEPSPSSSRTWPYVLGTGIALAGLGWMATNKTH